MEISNMEIWKLIWIESTRREGKLPHCENCHAQIAQGNPYLTIMSGFRGLRDPLEMEGPRWHADLCEECCKTMGVFKPGGQLMMPGAES